VRIQRPARPDLVGTATGIDPYGQLVVAGAGAGAGDGAAEQQIVGAGDVLHLR
jgi:hypothetical protein